MTHEFASARTVCRSASALAALAIVAAWAGPGAGAEPRGFPDLSRFTVVAPDSPVYMTNRMGGRNAVFATPDGLACNAGYEVQTCRSNKLGSMPGFPNNAAHQQLSACGPEIEEVTANKDGGAFSYSRNCGGGAVTDGLPILRAGQKVTVVNMVSCKTVADTAIPNCTPGVQGQATCVVSDNKLTACTSGAHGFVITTAGSWTF